MQDEDCWDQHFAALLKLLEEHGHTRVPFGKEYNGLPLGNWVASLRALKANLSVKRVERLEQLGFVWNAREADRLEGLAALRKYVEEHGHAKIPTNQKTEDRFPLGRWCSTQKTNKSNLSLEFKEQLNQLNFIWDIKEEKWKIGFDALKKYVEEHGHARVPIGFKNIEGYRLGKWISHQRSNKKLSLERLQKLNKLGFIWNTK